MTHQYMEIKIKELEKRIKALEQEPCECENAVSRQAVLELVADYDLSMGQVVRGIHALPPVTPQENKRSCVTCEWSKDGHCAGTEVCHLCMFESQYKQKADVLDKMRAEIEEKYGNYDICEWFEDYDYEENDISEYQQVGDVSDILAIIDKYRAESEGE